MMNCHCNWWDVTQSIEEMANRALRDPWQMHCPLNWQLHIMPAYTPVSLQSCRPLPVALMALGHIIC